MDRLKIDAELGRRRHAPHVVMSKKHHITHNVHELYRINNVRVVHGIVVSGTYIHTKAYTRHLHACSNDILVEWVQYINKAQYKVICKVCAWVICTGRYIVYATEHVLLDTTRMRLLIVVGVCFCMYAGIHGPIHTFQAHVVRPHTWAHIPGHVLARKHKCNQCWRV